MKPTQVDVSYPWGKCIRAHASDTARFGHMLLGMLYIQLDIMTDCAVRIARPHREVFASPGPVGEDAAGVLASIPFGVGPSLVF